MFIHLDYADILLSRFALPLYYNKVSLIFKMPPSLSAQDLFPVDGLIAVVTGAGSGIGAMIAKALSENGASALYT